MIAAVMMVDTWMRSEEIWTGFLKESTLVFSNTSLNPQHILNHIQGPFHAPANPNLCMDMEPVNLANECSICYAEEPEYGLNTCPHHFCLTCINRFQPQLLSPL